jgi:hypothetical protein
MKISSSKNRVINILHGLLPNKNEVVLSETLKGFNRTFHGSRRPHAGCVAIIKKSFYGILRRAATGNPKDSVNLPFSINML